MVDTKISKLSARIDKIQQKIDHVNEVADEAIFQLETQKRDLRSSFHPKYPVLEKNIQVITADHDKLVEKLLQEQTNVKQRKESLDQLDFSLCQLDREISRLQSERDRIIFELNKKREDILKALTSTENLTLQIKELDNQIMMLTETHHIEMEKLHQEREDIMNRTDLTEDEKQVMLAQLDQKIKEEEENYQEYITSLERQKKESQYKMREYDEEEAKELIDSLTNEINELEAMKVGASPSEVESLNFRIMQLREKMQDMEIINELRQRGFQFSPSGRLITPSGDVYTLEEAAAKGLLEGIDVTKILLRDKLKEKGLLLSKSGNIRTKSGRIMSLKEAKELGIEESLIEAFHSSSKKSSLSTSSATTSDMSSEDVNYLKVTVGKPLTLALAEICMKQPRDPIHYLGHWLFKYRYNQETDEYKKREVEELMAERERIQLETWHRQVEEAARAAVLEMIFKAHDEVVQKELEAEADAMFEEEGEEDEEEYDELAEEAKDVLGEYNGPTAGQRRI